MIKDTLRDIRFNEDRGYYFIYSMGLKNVLLPPVPLEEGQDFSNYQDIKKDYVVRNFAKLVQKNKESFYTWYWLKPSDKSKHYKKVGFGKYFEPFDWFIGTGEYLDDFEQGIKNDLIEEIQNIRYNTRGYIFMHDYSGICLTHINKTLIGKNRINYENNHGRKLVQEAIDIAKNGGGYFEYETNYGKLTKKTTKKISYVDGIDDWGWQIGAGFYLNDIDKRITMKEDELKSKLHKTITELIVFSVFATIILILVFLEIARRAKKHFERYKKMILNEMKKNENQLMLLQQQSKLASMGEMIGNIAHQWRQPLNTLSISISKMSLLLEDEKLTKEVMLSSFDRMEKSILYLSQTIDVFRGFFKKGTGDKKFNLKITIENTLLILNDSFSNNFIELTFTSKQIVIIKGNEKELQQVIINILNNSKDAIVSKHIKNAKVTISTKIIEDTVKIYIQDNGGGVPKEIGNKIFEPYFSTKFKDQGTGIGLYMSKIILEKHFKATIDYKNTKNGVEFCITLNI